MILTRDALPSAAALVQLHCRNQSDGNSQTHGHGRFQLMKCKYKYKCDTNIMKKYKYNINSQNLSQGRVQSIQYRLCKPVTA